MPKLQFDKARCSTCKAVSCLTKCQYLSLDAASAKKEWQKIINGEDSFVLEACTTCYACEEYCPHGNHPFYMIVDRQEEQGILPSPRPIITMWVNQCEPVGKFTVGLMQEKALSYCFLPHFNALAHGKLFEDIEYSVIFGQEFFCNAVYLHYAKTSLIRARLPGILDNIRKQGIKELICLHDECYATYASLAPAYGIEVPFKPVHYYEYLIERLKSLKGMVKPLGLKVAFQRNCSTRLIPQMDAVLDDLLKLIGVERIDRKYDRKNALCCAEIFRMGKGPDLADDVQKRNLDDMQASNPDYVVFNCPACWDSLAGKVAERGLQPIHIIDLCKLAIGEEQSLKLAKMEAEV
ncbi:MAG: (Fe-S)-binding protein [Dehalococcoidia bacterium]|nr:(Fe-S)-binding protein [Dehalococcoidia bacterium]MDD5494661.1 (Fe-S)-binding protein [Dehalococcoidia bacterium]